MLVNTWNRFCVRQSQEKGALDEWKRKANQNKVIGICGYILV